MASTMFFVIVMLTGTACMLQARSECSTTVALVMLAAVVLVASKHYDVLDDCATGDEGKYPFLDAIADDDEQWSDIGEQNFIGKVRVKRGRTSWEDERYSDKVTDLENDSQYKEHARTKHDFYDEYKYDGKQVYDDYEGTGELQSYDSTRTTPAPSTDDNGKPPTKRYFKISEQDEQNMRLHTVPKNWEDAKILLNSNELKQVEPMPHSWGFKPDVRKKQNYRDQNVFTNALRDEYKTFYDYDTTKTQVTKQKCLPTKFARSFAHDTSEKPESHSQNPPRPELQYQQPKKQEPTLGSLPRSHTRFLPQQYQTFPPQARPEFPSQIHTEFLPQPHQELPQLPTPVPRPHPELQTQSSPESLPQSRPQLRLQPNHQILPQTIPEYPPQPHPKSPSQPYPELLPESLPELPPQRNPSFSQKSREELPPQPHPDLSSQSQTTPRPLPEPKPSLQPQPTTRSQPPHTVHQSQLNRQPRTESRQPQSSQPQSLPRTIQSKPDTLPHLKITELTLYSTYSNKPWPEEEEEMKKLKLPPVDFTMAETFKDHMGEYLQGTLAWNIVDRILGQTQAVADTRRQVRRGLPARTRYRATQGRKGVAEEGLRRILEDALQKVQELVGAGGGGQSALPEDLASFLSWMLAGSRDEARSTQRTFTTDDGSQHVASMARLLERLLSSHDALGPRELPMARPQHDVIVGLYRRLRSYMETHTTTHIPLVRYDPHHDDDNAERRQAPWNFKVRHVWDEEPDRSHDYNKPQRS